MNPTFVSELYQRYVRQYEQVQVGGALPLTPTKLFGFTPDVSCTSATYYMDRGWSEEQARERVSRRQRTISVESIMRTHGCSDADAAEILRNIQLRRMETLVERAGGADALRAKQAATALQVRQKVIDKWASGNQSIVDPSSAYMQMLSNRRHQQARDRGEVIVTNTSLQWYLNKGLTVEEAVKMRSNRQHTFSLERCIERHGAEEGTARWVQRQEKWIATMEAKPPEERDRIIKARIQNGAFVSAESNAFFRPIVEHFPNLVCYWGEREYFINQSGKFWLYDFCIPSLHLIVEYNGTHVHPRDSDPDTWRHCFTKESKQDRLQYDKRKHEAATDRGFTVLYVWSDEDMQQQQVVVMSKIQELLNKEIVNAIVN